MGQTQARKRLDNIKENVDEITEKIKSDELTANDRNKSHDILLDYIKELNLILSKSVRPSRIKKVERLIIAALQELATLEATFKITEPHLKDKSLKTLHEIEKCMRNISAHLHKKDLETEKEAVNNYKRRISLVENVDHEVDETKTKLLNALNDVENSFKELEIQKILKELEEKHSRERLDLNRFVGVGESNCYKNHKQHLEDLKREVNNISEFSDKIKKQKKYLLFNIDNNLLALDKKVAENEEKIKRQTIEDVIFKTTTRLNNNNNNLIENFVKAYKEFEKSFTANCKLGELQDIVRQLKEVKIKIDQKLKVLESQVEVQNISPVVKLIPEKESDAVDAPILPQNTNNLKLIIQDVENLKRQVSVANFTVDGVFYNSYKEQLEECNNKFNSLTLETKEEQDLAQKMRKTIEEVSDFLNQKSADPKITSGDYLIDIMSINLNINQLEADMQLVKTAEECDCIENELLDNLKCLKALEISFARTNVCKFRDYVAIQIDNNLSRLNKIKQGLCNCENS